MLALDVRHWLSHHEAGIAELTNTLGTVHFDPETYSCPAATEPAALSRRKSQTPSVVAEIA